MILIPTNKGGLGLHDFADRVRAARIIWVQRILMSTSGPWLDYLLQTCDVQQVKEIFIRKNYRIPNGLRGFYRQLFFEWQKLYAVKPLADNVCRAEPLWENRNINMGFLSRYKKQWVEANVFRVNDIIYRGNIMTPAWFARTHCFSPPPKVFPKLAKAIPPDILNLILPLQKSVTGTGCFIMDSKDKMTDLGDLRAKDIYAIFAKKKKRHISAQHKWAQILVDFEEVQREGCWTDWYMTPYRVSREVRLQAFHYKVLHRTLPCNSFLHQLKLKPLINVHIAWKRMISSTICMS